MIRLAITPGEPAGIGPDLIIKLAQRPNAAELVVYADPELLLARARELNLPLRLRQLSTEIPPSPLAAGELAIRPIELSMPARPGILDSHNATYVLETLSTALADCQSNVCRALVTGPVHKGIINDAGIPFTGHTEFLAAKTHTEKVVMMLATEGLRVALATTHLPLSQVPAQITQAGLTETINILHTDLQQKFGLQAPRILVCGLNPHAGENGHLGMEEIQVIEPVLTRLRGLGMHIEGPLPADTLFTPKYLKRCDAVLAMYHDQGLPVLKHMGFGKAVNITLGLPIIRTSVDHGTALDLAGTGLASTGSLIAAITTATCMAKANTYP